MVHSAGPVILSLSIIIPLQLRHGQSYQSTNANRCGARTETSINGTDAGSMEEMARRTVPNNVAIYTITTTTARVGCGYGRRSHRPRHSKWSNSSIEHKNWRNSKQHGPQRKLHGHRNIQTTQRTTTKLH